MAAVSETPSAVRLFAADHPALTNTVRQRVTVLRAKLITECVSAAEDWPDYKQRRGVIIGLEHALRICGEADKEYRE